MTDPMHSLTRRAQRGGALWFSLVIALLAAGAVTWELRRRSAGRPFASGVVVPRRGTPVDVDGRWTVTPSPRGAEFRTLSFTLTQMKAGTILAGDDKHIPEDVAERAPLGGVPVAMEMKEPGPSLGEFADGTRTTTVTTDSSGAAVVEARVGTAGTTLTVTATVPLTMAVGGATTRPSTLRCVVK